MVPFHQTVYQPSSNGHQNGFHKTQETQSNSSLLTDTAILDQPTKIETPTNEATSVGADSKIEEILLQVISEKTGYPVDMLELDMDMEADLGIDSIKRVEIFGSMTEDHPEMSDVNPSDLAELRTLRQIVDYLAGKAGSSVTTSISTDTVQENNKVEIKEAITQSNNTTIDTTSIEQILLKVISEKTGYPVEMLELDMDMEADLGIDSIKRVEIFGSMTEDHPEMSDVNPSDLAELRTLRQIVDYLAGKAGSSATTLATTSATTKTVQDESKEAISQSNNTTIDKTSIEQILLMVISEKTGYPVEMLELDMDMEADLGIDSIKRVEIFGSMTEDHPEMSDVNPSDLAELRTLRQIVDYLAGKAGSSLTTSTTTDTVQEETKEVITQNNNTTIDTTSIEQILLKVISEKTGYPVEMLELDMDMEADLGIDSIKRVEIFGSMTEDHPEMSDVNPSDLAELRTLRQIVDYLAQTSKKKAIQ